MFFDCIRSLSLWWLQLTEWLSIAFMLLFATLVAVKNYVLFPAPVWMALLLVNLAVMMLNVWQLGRLPLQLLAETWRGEDRDPTRIRVWNALGRVNDLVSIPWHYWAELFKVSLPWLLTSIGLEGLCNEFKFPVSVHAALLMTVPPFIQAAAWGYMHSTRPAPPVTTIRGREVTPYETARAKEKALMSADRTGVVFGPLRLPVDGSLTHFLFLGATRSGKTVNKRLMQESLFRNYGGHPQLVQRAIVYDPKTSIVPLLVAMGVPLDKIRILNPFDARCWAWDIAADIVDPTDAANVASQLIPRGGHEFFEPASRDILASEMIAFHQLCPGRWTLRDLLLVNWTADRVEELLTKTPLTEHVMRRYSGDTRTMGNIVATVRKNLFLKETVAAGWHQAGDRKISFNSWRDSDEILVFGHDDKAKDGLDDINRAMFGQAANSLLSGSPDPARGRSWIMFDEVREAGKLSPGLSSLLLRGAEYGVHVTLGLQSIQGLWEVYGQHVAGELVGQTSNLAVFRLGNDRKSAEWAADVIGKAQRLEQYRSVSRGRDTSTTTSESTHDRHLYMPEELQTMKATCPEHGLRGVFVTDQYGVVDAADAGIDGAKLFDSLLTPPDPSVPRLVPRPPSEKYLQDWTPEEMSRLGLDPEGFDPLSQAPRL